MYSGKDVLVTINSTLAQINQQLGSSEKEVEQLNDEQINLEKSETEQFRKLAGLRLNLLASGDIIERLDVSERRAEELLKARLQIRQDLKQQIALLDQERSKLEQQRDGQAQQVDKATEVLDQREAETQKKLSTDSKYQQQLQQSQNAVRIAAHAEEKTELSNHDKSVKGKPYEQDAFFMYLWKRKYGTADYHANSFIRYLDKKIAYLCQYDKARANYKMLTELPVRLLEHAEIKRQVADDAFQALKEIEQEAAAAAGVSELSSNLDNKEQALQMAEQALEIHDAKVLTLQHREAAFISGDDQEFQDIIKLLVSSFQEDDLTALYLDAAQTPLPDDDLIVRELQNIKKSQQDLVAAQIQQRELIKEQQQRQMGLNSVQRLFKQSHYDAITSVFSDGNKVNLLLKQYLNGILDSNYLWNQLQGMQKNQAVYSDPFFGSGQFPDGVWKGGRSTGTRSGGYSFPRRGGSILGEIAGGVLEELSRGGGRGRGRGRGSWGGGDSLGGGSGGFKTGGGF